MFGANEDRVALLNSVSGETAYFVERSMFEAALLSICRMTDPPASRLTKDKNITVRRLAHYLSNPQDARTSTFIDASVQKAAFARSWRNKRLAHSDEAVRNGIAQLDLASRALVKSATDSIAKCIRHFAAVELETTLVTHPISALGNDTTHFLSRR
jgi:hypothetical protein